MANVIVSAINALAAAELSSAGPEIDSHLSYLPVLCYCNSFRHPRLAIAAVAFAVRLVVIFLALCFRGEGKLSRGKIPQGRYPMLAWLMAGIAALPSLLAQVAPVSATLAGSQFAGGLIAAYIVYVFGIKATPLKFCSFFVYAGFAVAWLWPSYKLVKYQNVLQTIAFSAVGAFCGIFLGLAGLFFEKKESPAFDLEAQHHDQEHGQEQGQEQEHDQEHGQEQDQEQEQEQEHDQEQEADAEEAPLVPEQPRLDEGRLAQVVNKMGIVLCSVIVAVLTGLLTLVEIGVNAERISALFGQPRDSAAFCGNFMKLLGKLAMFMLVIVGFLLSHVHKNADRKKLMAWTPFLVGVLLSVLLFLSRVVWLAVGGGLAPRAIAEAAIMCLYVTFVVGPTVFLGIYVPRLVISTTPFQ